MKFTSLTTVAALLCSVSASLVPRNHDTHDHFAVQLDPSASPDHIARLLGARHDGQIGELPHHHSFSIPKGRGLEVDQILGNARKRRLKRRGDASAGIVETRSSGDGLDAILWSQKLGLKRLHQKRIPPPPPEGLHASKFGRNAARAEAPQPDAAAVQLRREVARALDISDPLFERQWHLFNTVLPGNDMNVTGLWLEGITGKGAISAIVDDGLDLYSNDLKPNYYAKGSYDFNEMVPEPKPRLVADKHGTRCAGEVAAAKNDVCGVGIAYDSQIAGIRILGKAIDDADEALAVNYGFQDTQIYSCSWGPPDDGQTMETPGLLIQRAMVNGIQNGRGGKGSVFVFAAGNGASAGDNCNFDGYTNSIYSVTVGSIDNEGNHPYYSEDCSAQMVVTQSSGGTQAIYTTDVGLDKCFSGHGGTSAAGPLAVGTVALALSVRPDLTWRDVQYLFLETAVPVHEEDADWQVTKIGKKFSHQFGYGRVDAYTLVHKAKDWTLVKPQAWYHSPWLRVHHDIPQGEQGLGSTFEVTEPMLKGSNLARLEHVTVTMNVNHTRRGDLSVELRSPEGIVSHLSTARKLDDVKAGYVDWTFMSVAHWGESGLGKWTVVVKDVVDNEFSGQFVDWRLNFWGEAIDGDKQELHPLPDEHDDDHPYEDASPGIHTATVDPAPSPTSDIPQIPTDHIDRPVNEKPTTPTTSPSTSATATPSDETPAPTATPTSDSWLPSFFPTFGVSKRTQVWIYASFALIGIFCVALGVYFYVQRKKRLRNNMQDDYEFEMVADDDDEAAREGMVGGKRRRRGGELYDAFAGESDDEGLFSDDDHQPYHDRPEGDFNEKSRGSDERQT